MDRIWGYCWRQGVRNQEVRQAIVVDACAWQDELSQILLRIACNASRCIKNRGMYVDTAHPDAPSTSFLIRMAQRGHVSRALRQGA